MKIKKIVLIVFLLSAAAFAASCGQSAGKTQAQDLTYQCSMHPAITSSKPGDCPICGMRLTRVNRDPAVKLEKGKILFYRHPMRSDISSPVPAKDEMGMDYIPVYEEEGVVEAAPVAGRASVFIDAAKQQLIGVRLGEAKKQPLEIKIRALGRVAYDPDLHNTIGEYREAVSEYIKSKNSPSTTVRERAEKLMKLAELKLRLSGISAEQLEHLKMAGQSSLRLLTLRHTADDLSLPAGAKWIYADLYENEGDLAAAGQTAVLSAPSIPGKFFDGKIISADLIPNALIRTLRLRIETMDPEDRLREGLSVDIVLHISLGEKLVVPEGSILNTGERSLVFVSLGDGRFEPREVHTGQETEEYSEITGGLTEGEKVVSSANFLVDSESRIRAALQNFGGGHSHG